MGKHKHTDKQTGFWVDAKLLEDVQEILRSRGLTLTGEIRKMMERILEDENKRKEDKMNKRASHRTILTIAIDKDVAEFLKKYAKENNTNVSAVLEQFAKQLQSKQS
jgi:uncharacterized protein (DUF4415 family)